MRSFSNYLFLILFFVLATARFLIPTISALVIPVLLLIILFLKSKDKITIAALCLFSISDNGGNIYMETPGLIRYIIACSAIILILLNKRLKLNKSFYLYFIFFGILPLLYYLLEISVSYDLFNLRQNILFSSILLLSGVVNKKKLCLNYDLINSSILGFLIGEVFNIYLLNKGILTGEYLNYNSLKFLVIVPSIYFTIYNRRYLLFFIPLTLLTLINYGTRLILVIWVFILILIPAIEWFKKKDVLRWFLRVSLLTAVLITMLLNIDQDLIKSNKVLSIFYYLIESNSITTFIELLDPVRYNEFKMFFQRPFLNLIFGEGFGAGIYDKTNLLSFVSYQDTAFSINELNKRTFFNFHDVFIDLGLRFGIIPILILSILPLIKYFKKKSLIVLIEFSTFLIALYTIQGLIFYMIIRSINPKKIEYR